MCTPLPSSLSPSQAFDRYEAIRHRLPKAAAPGAATSVADLGAVSAEYDAFVFDAYGVLNVGERPVAGARDRVDALRAQGKHVLVLTNAASFNRAETLEKFQKLGFDFSADEIISSRAVCEQHLGAVNGVARWGVAAPAGFDPSDLPVEAETLGDDAAIYADVDGFLLLSSAEWTAARQTLLVQSLRSAPRPLVVANPDLVAPRETGLTLEPGFYAHAVADTLGLDPQFHGKPFPSVYDEVERRLAGIPPARIAMIGDTLHTDVLGAQARGWGSVLICDHGLFAGLDVRPFITQSGISPDWIAPSI
ncbi:HAD-IIA family hydrolase [Epibacterium sp. SM1969]|uniref:HAD-IIA family hydrolase n=1 Tax=Tritonibacter aquimaris TaxID=2663379 RepID=A0A844AUM7_9RHOB|nr:HAD-IIA family hydrolase [Tritonibacter aquimaris]MQY42114.1 HAD-IIA family hydrolase [Tritonibacter aquimaris]